MKISEKGMNILKIFEVQKYDEQRKCQWSAYAFDGDHVKRNLALD